MHSSYDQITLYNDLGLTKLLYPFTFNDYIKAIAMPDPSTQYDKLQRYLTGWGVTTPGIIFMKNLILVSNQDLD